MARGKDKTGNGRADISVTATFLVAGRQFPKPTHTYPGTPIVLAHGDAGEQGRMYGRVLKQEGGCNLTLPPTAQVLVPRIHLWREETGKTVRIPPDSLRRSSGATCVSSYIGHFLAALANLIMPSAAQPSLQITWDIGTGAPAACPLPSITSLQNTPPSSTTLPFYPHISMLGHSSLAPPHCRTGTCTMCAVGGRGVACKELGTACGAPLCTYRAGPSASPATSAAPQLRH